MRSSPSILLIIPFMASCDEGGSGPDPFLDGVESYDPTATGGFGAENLPDVVMGPPDGGGEAMGSTDVVSLGCGGSIVVRLDAPYVVDGPGADFIVFENAFVPEGGGDVFAEPGEVSVSVDGEDWRMFPCDPVGDPTLEGCAGKTPVLASGENGIDPTDPTVAGGDAFDLAEVGLNEARYVRIVDRTDEYADDAVHCTSPRGGFDLDAIAIVNGGAP